MTYLYVIMDEHTTRVKIGISSDPQKRLRQLQIGSASRLMVFATYGPWPEAVARAWENYLHQEFETNRANGEWFEIDPIEVGSRMSKDYEPKAWKYDKYSDPDFGYYIAVNSGVRRVELDEWPCIAESEVEL